MDPLAPRSCTLRHAGHTACGRVRDRNEDAHVVDAELGLFAVADGMGGHRAGDRASALAVRNLRQAVAELTAAGEIDAEALRRAVEAVNAEIWEEGRRRPERQGMGTTLTALVTRNDRFWLTHVGDSRAWRHRDGSCEQLTDDHTMVAEQVRQGVLSAEGADHHPMRNVLTRSLGHTRGVEVDVHEGSLRPGDVFVMASDGLIRAVDSERLCRMLEPRPGPAELAAELVRLACEEDGTDNVTVVVVACDGLSEPS